MKKINFSNTFKSGFTLIELLVVVAIISILVSIVLVSLNDGKNKANEAGVKANLNTVRGVAELFYTNNNNSFLPPGGTPSPTIIVCPSYDGSNTNMFQKDKTIANAITEAKLRGNGTAYCYNSTLNWAVAVGLKTDVNKSWCIDSGGKSKQVNFAPDTAINTTSFSCN